MGGSQKTMFFHGDFPKTLPQRRQHGPEWKNREKVGVVRWDFEGRAVENFFRPSISRKRPGRFLENFQHLRVFFSGPIYVLDRRSVGAQISTAAGGKVAKNGISDCGLVAFDGSLNFCTIGISNIFVGYVSRVIWQRETYICETY